MKIVLKIICFLVGAFLTCEALFLFAVANFNIGYVFALAIGLALLIYGIFYDRINNFCRKKRLVWAKRIVLSGLAAIVLFSLFLQCYGSLDNATCREEAVIVLGAAVHGETVSLPLKYRLDEAAEYLKTNKNAIAVVSGGQGNQENISEAEAMERYLTAKGIDRSRIIKEDKATSTYENFVYSKKILDEKFKTGYSAVLVTNEFHVFRAERIAQNAGFNDISHIGAKIDWYTVPVNCLRECAAVLKFFVFGK